VIVTQIGASMNFAPEFAEPGVSRIVAVDVEEAVGMVEAA